MLAPVLETAALAEVFQPRVVPQVLVPLRDVLPLVSAVCLNADTVTLGQGCQPVTGASAMCRTKRAGEPSGKLPTLQGGG